MAVDKEANSLSRVYTYLVMLAVVMNKFIQMSPRISRNVDIRNNCHGQN